MPTLEYRGNPITQREDGQIDIFQFVDLGFRSDWKDWMNKKGINLGGDPEGYRFLPPIDAITLGFYLSPKLGRGLLLLHESWCFSQIAPPIAPESTIDKMKKLLRAAADAGKADEVAQITAAIVQFQRAKIEPPPPPKAFDRPFTTNFSIDYLAKRFRACLKSRHIITRSVIARNFKAAYRDDVEAIAAISVQLNMFLDGLVLRGYLEDLGAGKFGVKPSPDYDRAISLSLRHDFGIEALPPPPPPPRADESLIRQVAGMLERLINKLFNQSKFSKKPMRIRRSDILRNIHYQNRKRRIYSDGADNIFDAIIDSLISEKMLKVVAVQASWEIVPTTQQAAILKVIGIVKDGLIKDAK